MVHGEASGFWFHAFMEKVKYVSHLEIYRFKIRVSTTNMVFHKSPGLLRIDILSIKSRVTFPFLVHWQRDLYLNHQKVCGYIYVCMYVCMGSITCVHAGHTWVYPPDQPDVQLFGCACDERLLPNCMMLIGSDNMVQIPSDQSNLKTTFSRNDCCAETRPCL